MKNAKEPYLQVMDEMDALIGKKRVKGTSLREGESLE